MTYRAGDDRPAVLVSRRPRLVVACCTPESAAAVPGRWSRVEPIDLAPGRFGGEPPRVVARWIHDRVRGIGGRPALRGGRERLRARGRRARWALAVPDLPGPRTAAHRVLRGGRREPRHLLGRGTGPTCSPDADPAADHSPVWSSDGASIVFVSERDGDQDIVVMEAGRSDERDVSRNPWPGRLPRVVPRRRADRVRRVPGRRRPLTIGDGNAEIFVVTPDGTDRRNVSRNPAWDGDPAWSPDGSESRSPAGPTTRSST